MEQNNKHIFVRYLLIMGLVVFVSVCIIGKASRTALIDARHWNANAEQIDTLTTVITPPRGNILARNGEMLAASVKKYKLYIDFSMPNFYRKEFMKNLDSLCYQMETYFQDKPAAKYKEELLAASKRGKNYVFRREATMGEFRQMKTFPFLELERYKNGFYADDRELVGLRVKPYGTMASRMIGGLDKKDLRGSSGLEKALDTLLYGVPGVARKVQLTKGMGDWVDVPPVPGMDVKTSIDISVQDITEQALFDMVSSYEAEFGVAIVMEVATGEIRSMSNLVRTANGDYQELVNCAVQGYEPGSVIKTLTMMIALEDGVVTPSTLIDTENGRFNFPKGRPITDEHKAVSMTAAQTIPNSSNIGLAKIALKGYGEDPDKFVQRVKEIGFMEPMNLHIPGATIPKYPMPKKKSEARVALSRMAYGYSTSIPPIYTLAFYNAIANNGKLVRPRLVTELIREGRTDSVFGLTYMREQMCKPSTAKALQKMLYDVVYSDEGTGKSLRSDKVKIAGKTGTLRQHVAGEGYTRNYRISFCGFFPYEQPKYSCIVLISNPNTPYMPSAGRLSGGVVKRIAEEMYALDMLGLEAKIPVDTQRPHAPKIKAGSNDASHAVCSQLNIGRATAEIGRQVDLEQPQSLIPNVVGMGARDAVYLMERCGVRVTLQGAGKVVSQSLAPGTRIRSGQAVVLRLN